MGEEGSEEEAAAVGAGSIRLSDKAGRTCILQHGIPRECASVSFPEGCHNVLKQLKLGRSD